MDRERLREVAREVAEATRCRLVVLFGSATRPEERRPEDLDLAVRADGPVDAVDLTNRFIRALGVQEIDIADLSRADPLLMMRVVQEGEVLYQASPHEFAHFYSLANRRWADTRKFREMEKERLKAYIARERGGRMTEVDAAFIRRKLSRISRNLEDLAAVEGLSGEEYVRDRFRKKGTERLLQETVEAAVDTNLHLLRAEGAETGIDYYRSFVDLGRRGVLSEELAEALAPAAGLRNRLVHEYDEIDDAIVLEAVAEARALFPRYVEAVERRLEAEGL